MSIEVSTRKVNDPQVLNVSSSFEYDVPTTIEEAQKRFPAQMEDGVLVDPVYEVWKKGFTIAIQAPARLELVRQWESIPAERRAELMVPHENDGVTTYTATLPPAQQALLQKHMESWRLGERAPRVRVEYAGDPVEAFLQAAVTMTDERKAEVAAQVAAMLGLAAPRPRRQ